MGQPHQVWIWSSPKSSIKKNCLFHRFPIVKIVWNGDWFFFTGKKPVCLKKQCTKGYFWGIVSALIIFRNFVLPTFRRSCLNISMFWNTGSISFRMIFPERKIQILYLLGFRAIEFNTSILGFFLWSFVYLKRKFKYTYLF